MRGLLKYSKFFPIPKLTGWSRTRFVGFFAHIGSSFLNRHQDRKLNEEMKEPKYILAPGTQVREEDFGLLFYTMTGPRLYFLSSGTLFADSFFQGKLTCDQWIEQETDWISIPGDRILELKKSLDRLKEKGVIHEC